MLLPHRGHRDGRHERGGPSVSPPHSVVSILLYPDMPPGPGDTLYCSPGLPRQAGMGIYGWDGGPPPWAQAPHSGSSTSFSHFAAGRDGSDPCAGSYSPAFPVH